MSKSMTVVITNKFRGPSVGDPYCFSDGYCLCQENTFKVSFFNIDVVLNYQRFFVFQKTVEVNTSHT